MNLKFILFLSVIIIVMYTNKANIIFESNEKIYDNFIIKEDNTLKKEES